MLPDETKYKLIMFDNFENNILNKKYWHEFYLPQWSTREKSRPSYRIENNQLTLYIADKQKPWCPKWNGEIRVSNLQTGVFSGKVGSNQGQHHFVNGLVVNEEQEKDIKVALKRGYVEFKGKCNISNENVAALWLIGIEEERKESAEICLFELVGTNVKRESSIIGYGIHPFGDDTITDCFINREININVSKWNIYGLNWVEDKIEFYINGDLIDTIHQSPNYPMQIMLNLYDLENINNEKNTFEIDYVKVYQLI